MDSLQSLVSRILIRTILGVLLVGLVYGVVVFRSFPKPIVVSGIIEADEARIGSRVGGRVLKVLVHEGDSVTVGQELLQLEPFDLLERKAEAAAKLELARLNYERQKELFQKKAGSKQELDQAQNSFQVAQATLDSMQKQIDELSVKATISGVVDALRLVPGDIVSANAPILTIINLENLWVRTYLPENRLSLKIGDPLTIRVDSYPNEHFTGKVTSIAAQAEFLPGNVQTPEDRVKQVFRTKISLDANAGKLRPGMIADVILRP